MRKNYFAKLVKYMKNVYHIERGLNKLSDGRVNPTYSGASNFACAFWFFAEDKKLQ
jgi:hypothetical protein